MKIAPNRGRPGARPQATDRAGSFYSGETEPPPLDGAEKKCSSMKISFKIGLMDTCCVVIVGVLAAMVADPFYLNQARSRRSLTA